MAITDVTQKAVERAIEEFDRLGRDEFLRVYKFGPAKRYFLIANGKQYDSKAIIGYAHGIHPGPRLTTADFTGGEATVARQLRKLGFEVQARIDSNDVITWNIEPGSELLRQEVHDSYGGPEQGGIAPSKRSPNILLFSTASGRLFGYDQQEGWHDPQTYLYTGEGQAGDQKFIRGRGNVAVRDHRQTNRTLRLFEEVRRTKTSAIVVRYVGEFVLDEDHPFERCDAPDGLALEMRSVIVFRLRPTAEVATPSLPPPPATRKVIKLPIESHIAETFTTNPATGPSESERREAALVKRYSDWLATRGQHLGRQQIPIPGTMTSLYTDLYDFTADELIEAKGTATRNHVRLAIGQLLDYDRYIAAKSKAVLLPVRPQDDLISLMMTLKISCIHETDAGGFQRVDP